MLSNCTNSLQFGNARVGHQTLWTPDANSLTPHPWIDVVSPRDQYELNWRSAGARRAIFAPSITSFLLLQRPTHGNELKKKRDIRHNDDFSRDICTFSRLFLLVARLQLRLAKPKALITCWPPLVREWLGKSNVSPNSHFLTARNINACYTVGNYIYYILKLFWIYAVIFY